MTTSWISARTDAASVARRSVRRSDWSAIETVRWTVEEPAAIESIDSSAGARSGWLRTLARGHELAERQQCRCEVPHRDAGAVRSRPAEGDGEGGFRHRPNLGDPPVGAYDRSSSRSLWNRDTERGALAATAVVSTRRSKPNSAVARITVPEPLGPRRAPGRLTLRVKRRRAQPKLSARRKRVRR
jgi:hypothetical protein